MPRSCQAAFDSPQRFLDHFGSIAVIHSLYIDHHHDRPEIRRETLQAVLDGEVEFIAYLWSGSCPSPRST